MPPAGLEPAALCLASSIRLSLTARQSWGCWLDYILDVSVPTRIVSEDPSLQIASRFPADYPILTACYLDHWIEVPEALRASPHTGSSTQWVPTALIPHQGSNKADALSAELQGHIQSVGMLARQRPMSTASVSSLDKQKEIARWGRPLLKNNHR